MHTDNIISQLLAGHKRTRQINFMIISSAGLIIALALVFRLTKDNSVTYFTLIIVSWFFVQILYWLLQKPVTTLQLLRYLDKHFHELQNSAELILTTTESTISKLQLELVEHNLSELHTEGKLLKSLPKVPVSSMLKISLISILITITIILFPITQSSVPLINESSDTQSEIFDQLMISKVLMIEKPAAYTNLSSVNHQTLSSKIHQGALVEWQLEFSQLVQSVSLEFINHPTIELHKNQSNVWTGSVRLNKTMIYHIIVNSSQEPGNLEKHRLEVITDQSPEIKVLEPTISITELPLDAAEAVFDRNIKINITDDYSIESTQMIITLAKGSGENVRFRDKEVNLLKQANITKKSATQLSLTYQLNLKQLGLEAGDELYFRIESTDNQQPEANVSRSGTYIIRWPDPQMMESEEMGSMMMKVMPDFFRSQRQIIIDTEKLINDKSSLTKIEFENKSQSIAESQKVLRLRYGQFLGEEYESGISSNLLGMITSLAEQEMAKEEEHSSESSGHDHDHQHGPSSDKKLQINSVMDVMTTFGHIHDLPEQSTLLDEQTKKLLKVALASMWEAELRLRLIQPNNALPPEYKALLFIKKAQQSERIYLQRVGFEPPPLKKERRLTAELEDINPSDQSHSNPLNKQRQQYQQMITALYQTIADDNFKNQLLMLEKELRLHLDESDDYLDSLADVKVLIKQPNCIKCKKSLIKSLWKLMPDSRSKVTVQDHWTDPLSETYRLQKESYEQTKTSQEAKQ